MKIKLPRSSDYVAKILGTCEEYGLNRDFQRKAKSKTNSECAVTILDDGLYEISKGGARTYVSLHDGRKRYITSSEIQYVQKACLELQIDLMEVYHRWRAYSQNRSGLFKQTADALAAPIRGMIAARNAAQAAERKIRVATMPATAAFSGSDAATTRAFLKRLKNVGPRGALAAALFMCQKYSSRAKTYSRKNASRAYDGKAKNLQTLCELLFQQSEFKWGWGEDPGQSFAGYVLYVDLPNGQVSFHSTAKCMGPDYSGAWDGEKASQTRILSFCDQSLLDRPSQLKCV